MSAETNVGEPWGSYPWWGTQYPWPPYTPFKPWEINDFPPDAGGSGTITTTTTGVSISPGEVQKPETKETNPKDAIGCRKVPIMSVVPQNVLARVAKVLQSGAYKYARHNYRAVGVRASVYVDAATGHLGNFWEGEDIDPDSLETHIINCIAGLFVLADSMDQGNWVDDRPPKSKVLPRDAKMNKRVGEMLDKLKETYGDPKPPYTEK